MHSVHYGMSSKACYVCDYHGTRVHCVYTSLAPVPPSPAHLFLHPSLLPLLIHHFVPTSITSSLFHSPLKAYLFHKSYPLSFTSSLRTASTDFCLHCCFWATRFLILIFSLFFVSGPCARLSWPSHRLLSARKSTVSYRIVSYCRRRLLQVCCWLVSVFVYVLFLVAERRSSHFNSLPERSARADGFVAV